MLRIKSDPKERFWKKVLKDPNGCWEWQGRSISNSGYGQFSLGYKSEGMILAHRYSYLINIGPIENGLWVLHKCDNRKCIRPDHLFLGNNSDNQLDASKKGRHKFKRYPESHHNLKKTHCPKGHPYEGENLRYSKIGHRLCRACCNKRSRENNRVKGPNARPDRYLY